MRNRKRIRPTRAKAYDVLALGDGTDYEKWGTISMDRAGMISHTATPGNEAKMAELMDESIPVKDPKTEMPRRITRQSDPHTWFEWLPIQYHGTAFKVVDHISDGSSRRARVRTPPVHHSV